MTLYFRSAFFLSIVLSVLFFAGCTKDKADQVVTAPPCLPDGYVVTYTVDIKPILDTSDGGSGFDYTNYEGIKQEVDMGTLENRVFVLKDMPSVSTLGPTTLTSCDLETLQSWIDGGAPE